MEERIREMKLQMNDLWQEEKICWRKIEEYQTFWFHNIVKKYLFVAWFAISAKEYFCLYEEKIPTLKTASNVKLQTS